MEIHYHERLASTHTYLIEAIRARRLSPPVAVVARRQEEGVGSRGSRWIGGEGNLFLSFALELSGLPEDLPLASASIYFAWPMRELLEEAGASVWLKWPNDFYIADKKAGGMITHVISQQTLVCSIGLNLATAPEPFARIDLKQPIERLLQSYFMKLEQGRSWKDVFREYRVEFVKSKSFSVHDRSVGERLSLAEAELLEDGSVQIDNRRVYSLR